MKKFIEDLELEIVNMQKNIQRIEPDFTILSEIVEIVENFKIGLDLFEKKKKSLTMKEKELKNAKELKKEFDLFSSTHKEKIEARERIAEIESKIKEELIETQKRMNYFHRRSLEHCSNITNFGIESKFSIIKKHYTDICCQEVLKDESLTQKQKKKRRKKKLKREKNRFN